MAVPLVSCKEATPDAAAGNMVETTSSAPCYLLKLPWEIRNKILRHLLYHHEPLRLLESAYDDERHEDEGCRNYDFSAQALVTCRQFHEEGAPILYSNTIGIDLCRCPYHEWQWAVAGQRQKRSDATGMVLDSKLTMLFHKADKFDIFMDLQCYDGGTIYLENNDYSCNSASHQLCKRLMEKKNLKQCEFDITLEMVEGDEFIPICATRSILGGFLMLRCKEANIDIGDKGSTYELEYTMLLDEPPRNLYAMQDALAKYVRGNLCLKEDWSRSFCKENCEHKRYCSLMMPQDIEFGSHCTDIRGDEVEWTYIEESVAYCDASGFLRHRSSILEAINKYRAMKERQLLKLDFA